MEGERLTSCATAAHGAVAGALSVAANVAYARVQKAFVGERLAIHVLNAPEAACGDCRCLRARRHVHRGGGCGGHREWADEAGQEGHREVGNRNEEEDAEKLQVVLLCSLKTEKSVKVYLYAGSRCDLRSAFLCCALELSLTLPFG